MVQKHDRSKHCFLRGFTILSLTMYAKQIERKLSSTAVQVQATPQGQPGQRVSLHLLTRCPLHVACFSDRIHLANSTRHLCVARRQDGCSRCRATKDQDVVHPTVACQDGEHARSVQRPRSDEWRGFRGGIVACVVGFGWTDGFGHLFFTRGSCRTKTRGWGD